MTDLEKKQKIRELKKIQAAEADLECQLEEKKMDIERIEHTLTIQRAAIKKLEAEVANFPQ